MITKEEVIPILLKASPAFEKNFNECQNKELLYVVLGDFAGYLLDLHNTGHVEGFKSVGEVIEQLFLDGDANVREATAIGLLEGIQNVWGNNKVDAELFRPYLLPESLRWWNELNAFWQGERRYVGEGLTKELSSEEVSQIREEVQKRFPKN
jgi:hypothetical protein